jgi:hypothetical protein
MPERKTSPKWKDLKSVDVAQCRVTRSRKGMKGSSQVIAEMPSVCVHHYSEGEDGPIRPWARRFANEAGAEFVHMSYHTHDVKGVVKYGQYGPWLPVKDFGEFIGQMIEKGVVNGDDVVRQLSTGTLIRLLKALSPEDRPDVIAGLDSEEEMDLSHEFPD